MYFNLFIFIYFFVDIGDSIKNYKCKNTWCSNSDGLSLDAMNNEFESKFNKLKKQCGSVLSEIKVKLTEYCQKSRDKFLSEIQSIDFKSC